MTENASFGIANLAAFIAPMQEDMPDHMEPAENDKVSPKYTTHKEYEQKPQRLNNSLPDFLLQPDQQQQQVYNQSGGTQVSRN